MCKTVIFPSLFLNYFDYRDGMVKMSETCEQFGGDIQTIRSQLDANAKEIDKASSLLHQYKVWVLW